MKVQVDFTGVPRCVVCRDRGYIDSFSPTYGHDAEECPRCTPGAPGRAKTRRRRVRKDVAALSEIRARRARVAPDRPPRGALYVMPGHEDDPYTVHRVNRRVLVLRSRSGGFAVFDGDRRPHDEWWQLTQLGASGGARRRR